MLAIALAFAVPSAFAQDDEGERFTVGVFADYTRLENAEQNFWGVGGRVGFGLHPNVHLEADVIYDFERDVETGTGVTLQRSGLRLLHGYFGPKFQTGAGPVKLFGVLKGGFLNFSVSDEGFFGGIGGAFGNITDGDTNGVFYPGGGIEAFAGPIGLRFEVGDLIYFDNGANHNLTVKFGPQFRF